MIRKIFMLLVVIFLFLYVAWNFYAKALSYDPLDGVSYDSDRKKDKSELSLFSTYEPAWSKEIYEKNLFSPHRSFREPEPIPVAVKVPVVVPPRRPEMVLKGIVLDTFGDLVAFIEIDKKRPIPMRKGDKAEDIELIDISEREVVLKWNTQKINLNMSKIKTITKPRATK
jgi:hypothetical protein